MDDMKISFKVEITKCAECPHLFRATCTKENPLVALKTVRENKHQLTKTCPMVRAQFEALE